MATVLLTSGWVLLRWENIAPPNGPGCRGSDHPGKAFYIVLVRRVLSCICCDVLDVFTEKEVLNNMSISLKDQSGSSTLDCKLRSSGVGILIGMKL